MSSSWIICFQRSYSGGCQQKNQRPWSWILWFSLDHWDFSVDDNKPFMSWAEYLVKNSKDIFGGCSILVNQFMSDNDLEHTCFISSSLTPRPPPPFWVKYYKVLQMIVAWNNHMQKFHNELNLMLRQTYVHMDELVHMPRLWLIFLKEPYEG